MTQFVLHKSVEVISKVYKWNLTEKKHIYRHKWYKQVRWLCVMTYSHLMTYKSTILLFCSCQLHIQSKTVLASAFVFCLACVRSTTVICKSDLCQLCHRLAQMRKRQPIRSSDLAYSEVQHQTKTSIWQTYPWCGVSSVLAHELWCEKTGVRMWRHWYLRQKG